MKSVQFAPSSSSSSLPNPPTPSAGKRRSSLKGGTVQQRLDPKTYSHSDPILRRLRLKDSKGKAVDLLQHFDKISVVLFLFGASGTANDEISNKLVEKFSERFQDQVKTVFVSIDQSEAAFTVNTQGKIWSSMEWNDGSNPTESDLSLPSEPFLLATDKDLEIDLSDSDTTGSIYLRPFSRVFLAEKFGIYGIPQLVVYHLPTRKILTKSVRLSKLETRESSEECVENWVKGVDGGFSVQDIVGGMKFTLMGAAIAGIYLVAARYDYDIIGSLSTRFMDSYLRS